LAAAAYAGPIYTSTNSGATWIPSGAPADNWYAIASSADGTKLVAVIFGGNIYTSENSGTTWTPANAPIANWASVASSGDGNTRLAAIYDGQIYASIRPALAIMRASSNILISWPALTSTNFALQQNSNLLTTAWMSVTNIPIVTNLQNLVTLLLPSTGRNFYRLQSH
jgi:acyl-CoA synthetase (AMP-forming)/AMP-acid ligase II